MHLYYLLPQLQVLNNHHSKQCNSEAQAVEKEVEEDCWSIILENAIDRNGTLYRTVVGNLSHCRGHIVIHQNTRGP